MPWMPKGIFIFIYKLQKVSFSNMLSKFEENIIPRIRGLVAAVILFEKFEKFLLPQNKVIPESPMVTFSS